MTTAEDAPPPAMIDINVTGQTVTKARAAGNVVAFLQERLVSIHDAGLRPQRTLRVVNDAGESSQPYAPPSGWSLVDLAVHPSRELTLLLTNAREVRLVRLTPAGSVRSDQAVTDSAVASDPYFNYAGGLKDDGALQPVLIHDAARVLPLGENLLLVLRTGRNAIVAYRLDSDATGAYRQSWRTLVEPGASLLLIGLYSGSFDTFGQDEDHLRLYADVDSAGTLAVGVVETPQSSFAFEAHAEYFNDPISAGVGVLLTRVRAEDGQRLGSTVIDTREVAELYGLRATSSGFALVGRVLTEMRPDGTGWDAFVAFVGDDGIRGPYQVVDVDRGDVLFDIAELPSGRYLGLGTTGYTQNPTGASISESAQPLLVLLGSDGALAQHLAFPAGPRHNQLTTVTLLQGRWLLGGMVNGPGTHSGDTDPSLIVADGFLRERSDLPN